MIGKYVKHIFQSFFFKIAFILYKED